MDGTSVTMIYLLIETKMKFFLKQMEYKIPKNFFYSRGTVITEWTIDQLPFFILFGSIEYTHNSELHVTRPKRHVRFRASPFN
ncbi:hypothetical protein RIF29_45385 [Crotalaria pallida]|uniref:Uncharacterized protein n=1 Tax=Crotalaria pallida TaxID=3830 RepID=A0AAN9HIU1_CROPI